MAIFARTIRSGIGAIARACAGRKFESDSSDAYASLDMLPKPEKTGSPPSKCYGSETSCHSDSW